MSESKPKVLFVLTSHDKMGDTGKPTGWYLPEFAHPYYELEQFCDITIVSPNGGAAPLDPSSVEMFKEDPAARMFLNNKKELWEKTEKLSSYVGKSKEFAAVFYVGGHGPMFDLVNDKDSIALIKEFAESDKIVAAVCHGPAVLLNVELSNGEHLLKDQEVTGFSNSEEDAVGLSSAMPFMLETELGKKSNGKYVKAEQDWGVKIVEARGGKLLTGQNPASAAALGKAVLHRIQGWKETKV